MSTTWRSFGLDAAWTPTPPSGVALVVGPADAPRLEMVARDIGEGLGGGTRDWLSKPAGGLGALPELLRALAPLHAAGCDVPLGAEPITTRRACDNALSRAYGARKAAVHSPTAERPGPLADTLRELLGEAGLSFLGGGVEKPSAPSHVPPGHCFEVYPHAAIVELMQLPVRLPYKVGRRATFFRHLSTDERFKWSAVYLDALRASLAQRLGGVDELLPSARSVLADAGKRREVVLKGYEDAIDAVVCAWVAHEALSGRTVAYGDETSAIRVPLG